MAFITDQNLADFLGDQTIAGTAQAILAASLASGTIAELLDNAAISTSPVTITDLVMDGPSPRSSVIVLPGFPVTNVTSVSLWDWNAAAWGTPLVNDIDYSWNTNGVLARRTFDPDPAGGFSFWPNRMNSIKVTYTLGSGTVPITIQAIALGIAARAYVNPQGLKSEAIAGYSIDYGKSLTKPNVLALDASEIDALAKWIDWGIA